MEIRQVWKCRRVKAGNKIRQQISLITHTLPELESLLSGLHPGDFGTKRVLFHVLTGNKSRCTMCWVYYVIMASLEVQNITQTTTRGSKRVGVCGVYTWWEYQHKSWEDSCSVRCYDWFLLMLCEMFAEFCPVWEQEVMFLLVRFLVDESIIDIRNNLCDQCIY